VEEELREKDRFPHQPPRHEGCLLRADAPCQRWPPPVDMTFGKEAVVGVEQGDGAVFTVISGCVDGFLEGGGKVVMLLVLPVLLL